MSEITSLKDTYDAIMMPPLTEDYNRWKII